jgi:GNAT superfamily N-acetyltransferase
MELARLVNEENGIYPMDLNKVAKMMIPSLFKEGGIVGVIGPKDKIEAGILLRVSSLWYADKPFLEEMSLFVHPDYRSARGGRASKLIEFAKKCATELGMPLMIGVLSNNRTSAKVRMYEKRLGTPVGAFFLWGAKTGQDVVDEKE